MSTSENRPPASSNLPSAKSSTRPEDRSDIRRIIVERGLVGLANDTKWDEFLAVMRPWAEGAQAWRYSWRSKWVNGYVSGWDCEWFYHLPFPFAGVEWLDVAFLQEIREHRLPPKLRIIDHSPQLIEALNRIGLVHVPGKTMIRIFGYGPQDFTHFDVEEV